MQNEQILLDGSIIFDIEALETAEEILLSADRPALVPKAIYEYILDAGEYRDFQKSAPANYFGEGSIPPSDFIINILESELVELYDPEPGDYENYERDLYSRVEDATRYYSQFAGYQDLVDILLEEFNYLFTSSMIAAAKNKISETAERIGVIVARGNEWVRDQALKRSVQGHNFWNDHQELFIEKFKLSLIAVPLVSVNAQAASALAVLEFLLEGAISDRVVVALDP